MGLSNSLRERLTDLEKEQRELTEKLAGSEPRAVRLRLRDTRRFVENGLKSLQSMWTGEARLVRAELAKHVQKITLTPEGRTYVASGSWDLLGGVAVTMVPGDRIATVVHSPLVCRWPHVLWDSLLPQSADSQLDCPSAGQSTWNLQSGDCNDLAL